MQLIQTQNSSYKKSITALYIEAFSTGISRQHIDLEELNTYIDAILKDGNAILAVENEKVIGALLTCPLNLDKSLPVGISEKFEIEKCVYIAEMMVSEQVRGQGIGKKLLAEFFKTVDNSKFSDAFIRVWKENTPALNLYKITGFQEIANITQIKRNPDGKGTFNMEKIYLHKKID